MAKKTAPIQEVSRLLDLVPYLSTHSHISLKELAQEFNVSEKEMTNELIALSMCGLPGYTPYDLIEVFFDSGFVTINNHDTLDVPRALTNLEVASLLIGLEIMKDSLTADDVALGEKIDLLISQLSSLVGTAIEIDDNPIAANLAQVQRAIATRSSLTIDYESALGGEEKRRTIDPLSIYSDHGHTYLSAYCQVASGYRNFRMDRITSIAIAEPSAHDHKGETESSDKSVYSLAILERARHIAEFLGIETQGQVDEIHIEAFSSTWIEKTVVSFAPDLVLNQPEELRAQVRQRCENILDLYRS